MLACTLIVSGIMRIILGSHEGGMPWIGVVLSVWSRPARPGHSQSLARIEPLYSRPAAGIDLVFAGVSWIDWLSLRKRLNIRFGSKADMCSAKPCPLSATDIAAMRWTVLLVPKQI